MRVLTQVLLLLVGVTFSQFVDAQDRFKDVVVKAEEVAPGLHMLTGAGGNLALISGDGAPVLIDDQFAEMAGKIRAAVAKITDAKVGYILNTHWHGDHTGGNESFSGSDAVIVAHENVRKRLSTDQFNALRNSTTKAAPEAAWPVVTFTRDLTLHMNGKTLQIEHIANAHTDGDSIVWFVEDNALHTGDLFFNGMFPYIDIGSGGSIRGTVAAADKMLARVNAETKIIPGHGPLTGRDDLRAYRDFLTTVADAIEGMIADGKTEAEVVAAKPTADFDAHFNRIGFFKPDQWVALIYKDLSR